MLFAGYQKTWILSNWPEVGDVVNDLMRITSLPKNGEAHEAHSLSLFLVAGILTSKLSLPIKVTRGKKGDSPDFVLEIGADGLWVGIEHTRATTEKYESDLDFLDKNYPEGSILEADYYSPKRSLPKKSKKAMRKPGEPLTGEGWGDFGMEEDWVNAVLEAIKKKLDKLNRPPCVLERNELLVEDVSHVWFFSVIKGKLDTAIGMLRKNQTSLESGFKIVFQKIHIITGPYLIYDVFGQVLTTNIEKRNLQVMWKKFETGYR